MPGIGELIILLGILSVVFTALFLPSLLRRTRHNRGARTAVTGLQAANARAQHFDLLYSQAIEQLGHEKAEVRMGAVFSIERIAYEWPNLRPAAQSTLQAFVDEKLAALPDSTPQHQVPNEIQTAQTALGRIHSWRLAPR